jgi:hypothetical protein
MSSVNTSKRDRWSLGWFRAAAIGAWLIATRVDAGSVVMRNGYIIHGPIVERSDLGLVLGWEYGKVRIHSRFIDSVVLEPGEDERLREQENKRPDDGQGDPFPDASGDGQAVPLEIPDFEVLVEAFASSLLDPNAAPGTKGGAVPDAAGTGGPSGDGLAGTPPGAGAGVETAVTSTVPPDGGSPPAVNTGQAGLSTDTPPAADRFPSPSELLAERVADPMGRFTLQPPKSWELLAADTAVQFAGPPGAGGRRASLNVVDLERGDLTWDECVELLKSEQREVLTEFEVLSEASPEREAASPDGAGPVGYEVVARGAIAGRRMVVRQLLVPAGGRLWLLSGFTAGAAEDPAYAAVEAAMRSFTPTTP